MNYLSTRDKSLNFNFKDIFLRGLAPDGGLFLPSEIRYYNKSELKNLSKLSYSDLAVEILLNFCSDNLSKDELRSLIQDAYKNFEDKEVVRIKKIGNMQKAVVLYRPLPKLLETLKKSGLQDLIKIDKDKKKDNNVTVGETK